MIDYIKHKSEIVPHEGDFYKPLSTLLEFAHRRDAVICNTGTHKDWNAFQIAPVKHNGDVYEVCDPEDAIMYGVYTSMDGGEKNWVADFSSDVQAVDFARVVSVLIKSYRP